MLSRNQSQTEKETSINYDRPLPPVETRWKPGQSGNPKGRPKKGEGIVDLLREVVNALCPTDSERRSYAELLMRSLLQQGLKGNLGAIKEILNRLAGRVPFPIERVVSASEELSRKAHCWNSSPRGSRVRMSIEAKNEILETLGIEPIDAPETQKGGSAE